MFEYELLERARAREQAHRAARGRRRPHPAGRRARARSAASPSSRSSASEVEVRARAAELGLDLVGAPTCSSPFDDELRERFAEEYARLRAHKGITLEQAPRHRHRRLVLRHDDGARSASPTAWSPAPRTRRRTPSGPAFEIIKTAPGVSVVSSVFLMALADRVLVYGDCAVIPDPTAEQLADIAISSAADRRAVRHRAARRDAVATPRATPASGADVEKVRAATALVRERAPDLLVEGPIQYDAAADPAVAAAKMPGSAGRRPGDGVHLPRPQHRQQHLQGGAAQRRARSRSGRCCRACASRSTTSRAARSSATSSTPSRSPRSRPQAALAVAE